MAVQLNQVFSPLSYQELFTSWGRFPEAIPYAGGTGLIRLQGRQILELPPVILSLEQLEDMHRISRSERYLEIGAMVKLSQIIDLGKTVPRALRHCLENIAGPQLRNMATIGGNICFPGGRLDSSAALAALDAQYELRCAQSARWISASRFSSTPGPPALNPQELLTRIRVPLDHWDYSVYKKFTGQPSCGRVVVFLAKTSKDVLSDIRIVCKTGSILRNRSGESILIGKQLPLSRRIIPEFTGHWEDFLSEAPDMDELSRKELLNFIEVNVDNLAA